MNDGAHMRERVLDECTGCVQCVGQQEECGTGGGVL